MADEYEQAKRIANRFLDKPYADPDGDEAVLARQFLRLVEKQEAVEKIRAQYQSQAKFADHEPAAYFREFVDKLWHALH